MKYRVYLENEYDESYHDNESGWQIECQPNWLDYELKEFCDHVYSNCDGWEWMKNSDERIIAIDETGKKLYFSFELDYEPVFYVSESKTKE